MHMCTCMHAQVYKLSGHMHTHTITYTCTHICTITQTCTHTYKITLTHTCTITQTHVSTITQTHAGRHTQLHAQVTYEHLYDCPDIYMHRCTNAETHVHSH